MADLATAPAPDHGTGDPPVPAGRFAAGMAASRGLLARRGFSAALILSNLVYLAVNILDGPFIDHDVIVYSLIGRALWQDGILPYAYAFDHKPFLTYFIYGGVAGLDGQFSPYAALGAAVMLPTAWFVHVAGTGRRGWFAVTLAAMIAAQIGTVGYSGNTEILFMPLVLIAVIAGLRAGRGGWFLLSALASAAAFSINYIAFLSLVPAVSWGLWSVSAGPRAFALRWLGYLAAVLAILAATLAALATAGMDLAEYFALQRAFLTGYAKGSAPISPKFAVLSLGPVLAIAVGAMLGLRPRPGLERLAVAMILLTAFGALGHLLNGHFYDHYAFTTTLPFAVLLLCLDPARRGAGAVLALLLLAVTGLQLAKSAIWLAQARIQPSYYTRYAPLAETVGQDRILSVNASVVPLYYARLDPLQPLVWLEHADTILGSPEAADAYRMRFLPQARFVLTTWGWCRTEAQDRPICAPLMRDFQPVLSVPTEGRATGYTLWQRPFR